MPQQFSEMRRSNSTFLFLASFFAFICLGGLSLWVSEHGYADPAAADLLRRAHAMASGPETILRQVSSTYPPVPLLLQAAVSRIPGFRAHLSINLLSAICASLLLGWLYLELCRVVSPFRAVFWTLLAAAHPFFLWAATSSLAATIALCGFLVLARAVLRIARWADARSFLTFTFVLAVSMFDWDGALILFLFLLLVFPAFLPSEIRRSSIWGGYISAFLMPFSAIACLLYTDWVFGKTGTLFSTLRDSTTSPNLSAFTHHDQAWLFVILVPLLSAPLALSPLFSFCRLRSIEKRAVLTCITIPSVLLFAGVAWLIPAHRTETLSLCAGLPAAILLGFLRVYKNVPALCTSLLLAGVLGGWATLMVLPLPEMQPWLDALRANGSISPLAASASLLPWLLSACGLFAAALGTAVLRQH
jgi:hypothetical protein